MNSSSYGQIVVIVIAIYSFVRGVMILTTGKLPEREEAGLRGYSENGLRKYKMLSAVMNILGGVFCGVITVVRMLNLVDLNAFRVIVLAILVVMVVCYIVLRNVCKNTK